MFLNVNWNQLLFADIKLFNLNFNLLLAFWNEINLIVQDANENNLLSFLSWTSTNVNLTTKLSHTMDRKDLNNKNKVYNTKTYINNWNKLALYFRISHVKSILINVYV
jgi:hypothetical protein